MNVMKILSVLIVGILLMTMFVIHGSEEVSAGTVETKDKRAEALVIYDPPSTDNNEYLYSYHPATESGYNKDLIGVAQSGGDWQHIASGDFDGDGLDEALVIHKASSATYERIYVVNPPSSSGYSCIPVGETDSNGDFEDVACGDWDGSGADEVFVIHEPSSGDEEIWQIKQPIGSTFVSSFITSTGGDFQRITLGDYDGDGKDEIIAIVAPSSGREFIYCINQDSESNYKICETPDLNGDFQDIAMGDFDGTGNEDILLIYKKGTQYDDEIHHCHPISSSEYDYTLVGHEENYYRLDCGDFDADGNDEVLVIRRRSSDEDQLIMYDPPTSESGYNSELIAEAPDSNGEYQDIGGGDFDGKYYTDEELDSGITLIPKVPYAVIHDPSGSGSYSFIKESTSCTLGAELSLSVGVGVSVEVEAEAFGSGAGASTDVTMTTTVENSVEIVYTTSEQLNSATITNDKNHIGPGYGDAFWGEGWDVHWKLYERKTYDNGQVINTEPVYRYSIIRSNKFRHDAWWVKQNMVTPWKEFLLGFDIGLDNIEPSTSDADWEDDDEMGTGLLRTWEDTTTLTSTASVEFKIEIEDSAYTKLGFKFGELKASGKWAITTTLSLGAKVATSNSVTEAIGYYLYDDESSDPLDTSDEIFSDIYIDKIFGTYHFLTDEDLSYTSRPHEHWTNKADTTPPTIPEDGVTILPRELIPTSPSWPGVFIEATANDLAGISNIRANIYEEDGTTFVDTLNLPHGSGSTGHNTFDTSYPTNLADGLYVVEIEATDGEENTMKTRKVDDVDLFFTKDSTGSISGSTRRSGLVLLTSSAPETVDLREVVDSKLEISIDNSVSDAYINGIEYSSNPEGSMAQPDLDKFIEIDASQNLDNALGSVDVYLYYDNNDLPQDAWEEKFKLYQWDETNTEWDELTGGIGTEGSDKYVKGTATSFGTFAAFGHLKPNVCWVDDSWEDQEDVDEFDDSLFWEINAWGTIEEAMDAVKSGGIIKVRDGTYDPLTIDKSVILEAQDDIANVIFDGSSSGDGDVITITVDDVTIRGESPGKGFTIKCSGSGYSGIKLAGTLLDKVSGCTIKNCNILGNGYGIYLYYADDNNDLGILNNKIVDNSNDGIRIEYSNNNYIKENIIYNDQTTNQQNGIYLFESDNNQILDHRTIESNVWCIMENNGHGIYLKNSDFTVIHGNSIKDNTGDGIHVENSNANKMEFNYIFNSPTGNQQYGIYITGSETYGGGTKIQYNDWDSPNFGKIADNNKDGIFIDNLEIINTVNDRLQIIDNSISDNKEYNIHIYQSDAIDIQTNYICGAVTGIYLDQTNSITINNNEIKCNDDHGVHLDNSIGINIVGNDIYDNNDNDDVQGDGIYQYYSNGNFIETNVIYNSGTGNQEYGTCLEYSNNNYVQTNNIIDDMRADGIYLYNSDNNFIVDNNNGNNIKNNDGNGITIICCDEVMINNNILSNNENHGILLDSSTDATLINTYMTNCGLMIRSPSSSNGDDLNYWTSHNIGTSNKVNGNDIYYWKNLNSGTIDGASPYNDRPGQVILANCMDITVQNLNNQYGSTLCGGSVSILMGYSTNCLINNNYCNNNNNYGICLWANNMGGGLGAISNNQVKNNEEVGIYLFYKNSNILIDNNDIGDNYVTETGILLVEDNDANTIVNNEVKKNMNGIYLYGGSDDNYITNNDIIENDNYGVRVDDLSTNNRIYHNNFEKNAGSSTTWSVNTLQAYDGSFSNIWDDGISDGNYWLDWFTSIYPVYYVDPIGNPPDGGPEDQYPSAMKFST